ncbi:MAG: ABC transporter permease [Chitinophagaceae bacterium]|nr:ABC transporter permease [Chitinophagaceae bacterium]
MSKEGSRLKWKITSKSSWFGASFAELWSYRDLLFRMSRKDLLVNYQQTLLGPLWMVLQPLITVITYVLVFDRMIGLPTDGIPSFLFYFTGITLWNLFADIFTGVSTTFAQNENIFSKVYFPRLIAPLATLLLHLTRFLIQLSFLIIVVIYYHYTGKYVLNGNILFCILPVLIIAGIAFGAGLIFSVITVTYRDLTNLQQLLVRLLMFVCPIFYSASIIQDQNKWLFNLNPLSSLFESFRYGFLGKGQTLAEPLLYSTLFMLVICVGGISIFNKKSDRLIDIV